VAKEHLTQADLEKIEREEIEHQKSECTNALQATLEKMDKIKLTRT